MKTTILAGFAISAVYASGASAATLQDNLVDFGSRVTHTVSADRVVHLYSWHMLQSVLPGIGISAPLSPTDYRIKQYLRNVRDLSFLPGKKSDDDVAGPGIYAAVDPIAVSRV